MTEDVERMKINHYDEWVNHPDCIKVGGRVKLPPGRVTPEQINGALGMKVLSGDIFVTSYPKSGTTWTQAILWWIINVHKTYHKDGLQAVDQLEAPSMTDLKRNHHRFIDLNGADNLDSLPLPRVIVSHLPFDLLPKLGVQTMDIDIGTGTIGTCDGVKVIHVIRDPKDACISYFHMIQMAYHIQDADLSSFIEHFINGTGIYGDYFDTIKSYWNRRYDQNLLILFYEEMLEDAKKQILRIAQFLSGPDADYYQILKDNDQIIVKIVNQTTFKTMKDVHMKTLSEEVAQFTNFYRKGICGDYVNFMDARQIKLINERIKNELGQPFVHKYVRK